jgi:crotonobetainyl-CoA:carnitine CoA-transferase CaiB-like acyl-CoA transferase
MSSLASRLSATPGSVEWAGPAHGADTADVLAEIGIGSDELEQLRSDGVV